MPTPVVQRFSITIPIGSLTATATRGVTPGFDTACPPDRTLPSLSQRVTGSEAANHYGTTAVISAWSVDGESLTFTRLNSLTGTVVNVEVATFPAASGVLTQHAFLQLASNVYTDTVAVPTVPAGHGRFIISHGFGSEQTDGNGSVAGMGHWWFDGETTLRLSRSSSSLGAQVASCTVVDYFGATVQSVALNTSGITAQTQDYAVSAVALARTALFGSLMNGSAGAAQSRAWHAWLPSTASLRLSRGGTDNVVMLGTMFIVEFPPDDATVQVLTAQSMPAASTQVDFALGTASAESRTLMRVPWVGRSSFGVITAGGDTPSPNNAQFTVTPVLTGSDITSIRANRATTRTGGPDALYFEALTWPEVLTGDTLSPSSIVNLSSFGAATTLAGPVIVSPTSVISSPAFGEPTVQAGEVLVAPPSITSSVSFGSPAFETDDVLSLEGRGQTSSCISPTTVRLQTSLGLRASSALGGRALSISEERTATSAGKSSVVGRGQISSSAIAHTLTASGLISSISFGTPVATPGPASVLPAGLTSTVQFGIPVVQPGPRSLQTSGLSNQGVFGAPIVTSGSAILQPQGEASTLAFGTPQVLRGGVSVVATGLESGLQFGGLAVLRGSRVLGLTGLPSNATVGSPVVTQVQTIALPSLVETPVFGAPSLQPGSVLLLGSSVISSTAFGVAWVLSGDALLRPSGLEATSSTGRPAVLQRYSFPTQRLASAPVESRYVRVPPLEK